MTQGPWYRRLSIQLIAFLTLALLPLGLVALFQTNRVAVEADRTQGLALLGMTERAARGEQLLIERAVGVARLFGSIAPSLIDDRETCSAILSGFIQSNVEFSFIGVLPPSGIIDCSSAGQTLDFTNYPRLPDIMEAQEPTIVVNQSAPASGESVFVVSEPFAIDGRFAGFVSVSIPHSGLPETSEDLQELGLVELITFNGDGVVLTSRSTIDQAEMELPAGAQLAGFSIEAPQTFRALNRQGEERRYSVVAVKGVPAAVMAVWQPDDQGLNASKLSVAPIVFPTLMWFASMGVAMLAMHTLVLRHLTRLRRNMDAFADDRRTFEPTEKPLLIPAEIANVEENFTRMSGEILRDEAVLEDAIREKGVLVKEIHHRVKNNLQLISSIMNMQIRTAKHEETKTVLTRVQDRVLSLATIHRDLYQSQDGGRVNVGALITEIIDNSVELVTLDGKQMNVTTDIQQVMLYPDQAVPLSLLVAEAATNAMKYIGDQQTGTGALDVSFKQQDGSCLLVMTNSIGEAESAESTGLGAQLMNAFAMQLGGTIQTETHDESYSLSLAFNALEFQPEAKDF